LVRVDHDTGDQILPALGANVIDGEHYFAVEVAWLVVVHRVNWFAVRANHISPSPGPGVWLF
jgi:hypothetical protein